MHLRLRRTCAPKLHACAPTPIGEIALLFTFASFITACRDPIPALPTDPDSGTSLLGSEMDGGAQPETITIPLVESELPLGNGGSSGTGRAAGTTGGIGGGLTATGGSGIAGESALSTGGFPTVSAFCGDRVRDIDREECDDGPLEASSISRGEGDLCNTLCEVTDTVAIDDGGSAVPGGKIARVLGAGRHPIAASNKGIAVALVQTGPVASELTVRVARFDEWGHRKDVIEASDGLIAVENSDPVVAMLPNGDTAVAFADFDGDGDGMGIVVRLYRAGVTSPEETVHLPKTGFGAQYAPDIVALSDRLIVAWTDSSDAWTGPDIRSLELSLDLSPLGNELKLNNSAATNGRAALSVLDGGWGAAWRTRSGDGGEAIQIFEAASNARFSVPATAASEADEVPSLLPLDVTHRLVLFASPTDLDGDDLGRQELFASILDTATLTATVPQQVPVTGAYLPWAGLSRQRPAAVRAMDEFWFAWSSGAPSVSPTGEDAWLERVNIAIGSDNVSVTFNGELILPRLPAGNLANQRNPALTMLPPSDLYPKGVLISAWSDYSDALPHESHPDVVVQMTPLPMLRAETPAILCSVSAPCAAGQGPCMNDNECATAPTADNVCDTNIGAQFGWGIGIGVCAPEHCRNALQDGDETGPNCGGGCGPCMCGDGIPSPLLGEECDPGVDSNCSSSCTSM